MLVAHRFDAVPREPNCDYKVTREFHIHNKLRLAVLHLGADRIRKVVAQFTKRPELPAAFARLAQGDAWFRRQELQKTRRYDDDWFFERFEMAL